MTSRSVGTCVAVSLFTWSAAAFAGDDAMGRPIASAAPLAIPHTMNLELDRLAARRARRAGNTESSQVFDLTPGLEPLEWPRPGDVRSRLVTPGLRRTPFVGWIAANLYRSRRDNGWCLEVDPGEGEYLVFYRHNLR